jgi:integrase/recombinase XerD
MNKSVSLQKRIKVGGEWEGTVKVGQKWRFCEVVEDATGRPKKDIVIVDGDKERHPSGNYYLDYRLDGKRIRENVGEDFDTACDLLKKKRTELSAIAQGIPIAPGDSKNRNLSETIADYLDEVKSVKKRSTHNAYSNSLAYFQQSCKKSWIEDVNRTDMLAFSVYLRETEELSPRTVSNTFANVCGFFKWTGHKLGLKKHDRPVYVEEEPEVYEQEEIDKLLAACTPEESRLFRFFRYSGFREQEVMNFYWRDLLPTSVKVSHKPDLKWSPKAYKERSVPLPAAFASELISGKPADAKPNSLVFPAPEGGTDGHMLRKLKAVATRAGMDPNTVWLHKWRSTFATHALQNGVDLRTVQSWMGHVDLASTMRYLKPARGAKVQAQVEALWAYVSPLNC